MGLPNAVYRYETYLIPGETLIPGGRDTHNSIALRLLSTRNALDPTEAVMIRGKGEPSCQPLDFLIITASVESRAFLD